MYICGHQPKSNKVHKNQCCQKWYRYG